MKHKCPIGTCDKMVPSHMLMCATHWHMVPAGLQNAVYRWYRTAPRSDGHFLAMKAAVDSVCVKLQIAP
jgi:hypothetical protein